MPNEVFYQEIRDKAIIASSKKNHESVDHGAEHLFVVAIMLFSFSGILFYFLNLGEVKDKFFFFNDSSGKLVKGLIQLLSLQLLFLSLGIFYRSFMMLVVRERPDGFVDRVVDVIRSHLNPSKSTSNSEDSSNFAKSSLWVSLVLAITVNISVSISNYFEHMKPDNEVSNSIRRIEEGIASERNAYSELRGMMNAELTTSKEMLSSIQEQLINQSENHNSALKVIGDATSSLNQSIKNFDGISVQNSLPEKTSSASDHTVKIENRVNIDNPNNLAEINDLIEKVKAADSKNAGLQLAIENSRADFLCLHHDGFVSRFKSFFNFGVERADRLVCKNRKIAMSALTNSLMADDARYSR